MMIDDEKQQVNDLWKITGIDFDNPSVTSDRVMA